MKSGTTRGYQFWAFLFGLLSFLCLIGPFVGFGIAALAGGALVYEKVAFVGTVFVVLIMSVVAAVNKVALRSRVWIVLFGLWLCLDSFLLPLLVVGACQIVDELVISPLRAHCAAKASINAEIDKRGF